MASRPQACWLPAVMSTNSRSVATWTGIADQAVVPSPSCPAWFRPLQTDSLRFGHLLAPCEPLATAAVILGSSVVCAIHSPAPHAAGCVQPARELVSCCQFYEHVVPADLDGCWCAHNISEASAPRLTCQGFGRKWPCRGNHELAKLSTRRKGLPSQPTGQLVMFMKAQLTPLPSAPCQSSGIQ